MTMLRRLAGEKAALDLVLTGRTVGCAGGARAGAASRGWYRTTRSTARAAELTRALVAAPASALAITKQLFYQLDGQTFDQGIALGARVNALVRQTPDFRDAIGRFLART